MPQSEVRQPILSSRLSELYLNWTDASKALGDSSPLGISTLFRSLGGWGTVRLLMTAYEARQADRVVLPVGRACCKHRVRASRRVPVEARILIGLPSMVRTLAVGSASGCVVWPIFPYYC